MRNTISQQPWLKLYTQLGIQTPVFADRPIGDYVEHYARDCADAPALQFMSKAISYSELNTLANQLAHGLAAHGVGRSDVIGLHLPNLPHYIIALVAISKLGAVGSGVSPLLAPPELAHQIEDAGISVLLTLSDFAPVVNAMNAPACLKTIITCGAGDMLGAPAPDAISKDGVDAVTYQALTQGMSGDFIQVPMQPHDTYMIQYTGGTTGRAKGAMLSLRTLTHNPFQVYAGDPPMLDDGEVFASAFPYFHIAGLTFALGAIMVGAHTILIPNPRDTDHFCAAMKAFPPTRLAAVPALYDMLLANPAFKAVDYSRLQVAKTGAAPMSETTRSALDAVIGTNKVSDVFGMTETGPCYTFHPLPILRRGSVGIPVPGADVRIMDVETGTKVMPLGEVGEICSSGPQTMKGYLNLPSESAHALRVMDGKTWMYSGDVGYMDADGYIFLCDRAKDMLIVGGFKVFSVEVEDKLKAMPQIAESAVIGTPDTARPGNDIVHLFVQVSDAHKDTAPDTIKADITAFMRETMAAYKVPKAIHIIDAIPLTPVGKIDKKALRARLD